MNIHEAIALFFSLGKVPRGSPFEAYKKSYRKLSRIHHPDKNGNSSASTELIKTINSAYDLIKQFFENNNSNYTPPPAPPPPPPPPQPAMQTNYRPPNTPAFMSAYDTGNFQPDYDRAVYISANYETRSQRLARLNRVRAYHIRNSRDPRNTPRKQAWHLRKAQDVADQI